MKPSSEEESISSETPSEPRQEIPEVAQEISEPAQEMPEPAQEISTEVDEDVRIARVRALLQETKRSESEVPLEAPKKKKRNLF